MELAPCDISPCTKGRSMGLPFQKKRERLPPLIKQASARFKRRTLVPLEAKQASPESAAGSLSKEVGCQLVPPSKVRANEKFPVDGIANHNAALFVPEFHGIQEHASGIVFIYFFPMFAAINGL